jgi:hypothetical protein
MNDPPTRQHMILRKRSEDSLRHFQALGHTGQANIATIVVLVTQSSGVRWRRAEGCGSATVARRGGTGVLHQVQRHRLTGSHAKVTTDSHQRLTVLVKLILETNHNALKVGLTALCNVVAYFAQIDIVEGRVNLVHDKEGGWMERVNGKQQGQGRHRLFSSTQLLHVSKSFHRRHRIELHSPIVRFVCVFQAQESVAAKRVLTTLGHVRIDRFQCFINVIVSFIETSGTFRFDLQKLFRGNLGVGLSLLVFLLARLALLISNRVRFSSLVGCTKTTSGTTVPVNYRNERAPTNAPSYSDSCRKGRTQAWLVYPQSPCGSSSPRDR